MRRALSPPPFPFRRLPRHRQARNRTRRKRNHFFPGKTGKRSPLHSSHEILELPDRSTNSFRKIHSSIQTATTPSPTTLTEILLSSKPDGWTPTVGKRNMTTVF